MNVRRLLLVFGLLLLIGDRAWAQLPSDAVILDKVKISEKLKSVDIDPVTLEPSDPNGASWEYKGVKYRAAKPDSQEKFNKDPDAIAKKAEKHRFLENFKQSMSTIWCPVTDEVNPGGMLQWKKFGLTFESCCAFCDENAEEEHFVEGLKKLNERAEKCYQLIGAKYTEGAKSPVEGAIKTDEAES